MKLVNDHGLFASRPREVRKRLPGGRSALCQSGDWLGIKYVLGFGASACSPPTGVCLIFGVKPRTSIHALNSPIPWPYAAGGVHR